MKSLDALPVGLLALADAVTGSPVGQRAASVRGFDVSNHQSSVDFNEAYADGARFVMIKATEGTVFEDPNFGKFHAAAAQAGLVRGGYHFGHPGADKGAAEADFFLRHGGGWSNDGVSLPGMLDLESAKGKPECYGLSAEAMVLWISDFVETYREATGRYPMIYTGPSWWKECTGDSQAFKDKCPLVLARYSSAVGPVPGGWKAQTIWQNGDKSPWGGDADVFNGDATELKKLAAG
ncbi:Lysozyme [Tolypocladium capitatum]|uniref:N,O-diacetylmuramidase n=1 Tax=Tolypocladium capitatum TaxID=45235 RepID=A0A2K3QMZ4_9HYPO|nr:Lysozyme [Tolypocladium capitatum]